MEFFYIDAAQTIVRIVEPDRTQDLTIPRFEAAYRDGDGNLPEVAPFQGPGLAALQAELNDAVDRHADSLRVTVAGTNSQTQLEVYRNKYERAQAGDLSFLEAEAAARGISAAQLAAVIIQKAEAWRDAGQAIEAARGAHKTAIAALNLAGAETYDVQAGWPALP